MVIFRSEKEEEQGAEGLRDLLQLKLRRWQGGQEEIIQFKVRQLGVQKRHLGLLGRNFVIQKRHFVVQNSYFVIQNRHFVFQKRHFNLELSFCLTESSVRVIWVIKLWVMRTFESFI